MVKFSAQAFGGLMDSGGAMRSRRHDDASRCGAQNLTTPRDGSCWTDRVRGDRAEREHALAVSESALARGRRHS